MSHIVEPKICELCRRRFFRKVTIRALAEKDCPQCSPLASRLASASLLEDRLNRREAVLSSTTRVPFWTPQRIAERMLSF